MAEQTSKAEVGGNPILTWATVFEKEEWSTGAAEIVSTLINIESFPEHMTPEAEAKLRYALKNSAFWKDEDIMDEFRAARKGIPRSQWWWWPESI